MQLLKPFLSSLLCTGLIAGAAVVPAGAEVVGTFENITGYGGGGTAPDVDDAGRMVAFASPATDLTPDDTNGETDIFVHDTLTGETINITHGANGHSQGVRISADGSAVTFASGATNLIPGWTDPNGSAFNLFHYDVQTGLLQTLYSTEGDYLYVGSISADGSQLASSTSSGAIFVWEPDKLAGVTMITQANGDSPAMSDDAEFVVFTSTDPSLRTAPFNGHAHVYLWERSTGAITEITPNANELSRTPTISADGAYVGFVSKANNLTANDTNGHDDFFVWKRATGTSENITESATSWTWGGQISADGNRVAITTHAANLTDDEGRAQNNVVIWDRVTDEFTNLTVHGNNESAGTRMSADGRTIGLIVSADNLTEGDTNGRPDAVIWRGSLPPGSVEPMDPWPVDPDPADPDPAGPEPMDPWPAGIWMEEAATFDEFVNADDFDPQLHGEVLRLYPAFFNREADLDGAQYWILNVFASGQTIDQITQYFADPEQAEFVKFYEDIPADDHAQYLERVYLNMLGRVPDEEGFAYWLGLMEQGELDRGSVVRWVALNQEFVSLYDYGA